MTHIYRGLIGQVISVKGLGVSDGSCRYSNVLHVEFVFYCSLAVMCLVPVLVLFQ